MAVEGLLPDAGLQVGGVVLGVLADVGAQAEYSHPVHLLTVVPAPGKSNTDNIQIDLPEGERYSGLNVLFLLYDLLLLLVLVLLVEDLVEVTAE